MKKNQNQNETKKIKGIDLLLVDNLQDFVKESNAFLKEFVKSNISISDDGLIKVATNANDIETFKSMVNGCTMIDLKLLDETSNKCFRRVLNATFCELFKTRAVAFDKTSELNSYKVELSISNLKTFLKTFIRHFMLLLNLNLVEYNNKVVLVDEKTYYNIKLENNYKMWHQIRKDIGLDD